MRRRTFIKAVLAASAAMFVSPLRAVAGVVPALVLYRDGIHDDTEALQAVFDGKPVVWADSGETVGDEIEGHFLISRTIELGRGKGVQKTIRGIVEWRGGEPAGPVCLLRPPLNRWKVERGFRLG